MVSRRSLLTGLGLGAAGIWGWQTTGSETVEDVAGSVTGGEPEIIKTAEPDNLIQELTFYDNGDVDILLKEDHSCYTQIEFSHTKSTGTYKTWDAPEFAGPKTVDMGSVVESNGPYPDAQFELEMTGGDDICIGSGLQSVTITVPDSYLPE